MENEPTDPARMRDTIRGPDRSFWLGPLGDRADKRTVAAARVVEWAASYALRQRLFLPPQEPAGDQSVVGGGVYQRHRVPDVRRGGRCARDGERHAFRQGGRRGVAVAGARRRGVARGGVLRVSRRGVFLR